MEINKKSAFWWTGIGFICLAVVLIGLNVFYLTTYDKVEGENGPSAWIFLLEYF